MAVVTGVGADVVYITEENYDDTVQWIGTRDYSRSLPVVKLSSGHFQIQSPEPIYGWISLLTPPPDVVRNNNAVRDVAFFACLGILALAILGFALYAKMNHVKSTNSVFRNLPELQEAELDECRSQSHQGTKGSH